MASFVARVDAPKKLSARTHLLDFQTDQRSPFCYPESRPLGVRYLVPKEGCAFDRRFLFFLFRSPAPLETVGDDADLQEVYDTERQLLYVACTRARDLLVTGVRPVSEFLDDITEHNDAGTALRG
jgi:hypothetical protein